jgi:cytochrome c biogenesis protein CcdA/thiol-disulfide isomerase/thioredoxin
VIVLIGIGLLAGIVTALSPCVLPVLPVLLAGGASGRKPIRIVAGLVVSFSVFTLFAAWILDQLGLPEDLLRNLAIALLFLMAVTLIVPQAAQLLERPLAFFSRFRPSGVGGGFFLGATLGLVFVPCAGPVLATVTVVAAQNSVGVRAVVLTFAYAIGAAIPMLLIARGGREASARLRSHAASVRLASGVLIGAVALALVFHLDDHIAQFTPGYTTFLQNKIESNSSAKKALAKVRGGGGALAAVNNTGGSKLPDYGAAPAIHADGAWINSPPLTLQQLRGKVMLVDFWTYSCINCLRTLPHLKAWYAAYHKQGLDIIGVHTPEFAFEHVTSNVQAAVKRLGVTWPVVQDNKYKTWDNYSNQYWPAEYLIDRSGRIRHTNFGEGEYGQTESLIRTLLGVHGKTARKVANATPTGLMTPETYLGFSRLASYVGSRLVPKVDTRYTFAKSIPQDAVSYAGNWRVDGEQIVAGRGARLRLNFEASDVYIVLGGRGTVHALINGKPAGTIKVDAQRLYTVRAAKSSIDGLLELRFSPGIQAYSFTFG